MIEIVALMLLSQQPLQPITEGIASYYTSKSSGAITASGEPMVDSELTCAMRCGEFGTYFLVVAENGRSVVCRLNDRGPYIKGRVIDLSHAAMTQLADGKPGKLKVKVFRLGTESPPPAPEPLS